MSKLIYVFGGSGQQGAIVSRALLDQGHEVIVLDERLKWNVADAHHNRFIVSPEALRNLNFEDADLVVNTLPSAVAPLVTNYAIAAGKDVVDLAFSMTSPEDLFECASNNGARLLHDCGLAPGLPNLLVGHELANANACGYELEKVDIYVGGISLDPVAPLGYVNTWSLDDLYEEYTRPARLVRHHEVVTEHPLYSPHKTVWFDDHVLERFYSDGLRSLLRFKDQISHMREFTLRRPGHMACIKHLIDTEGKQGLISTLTDNCSTGKDLVLLRVDIDGTRYDLEVRGTSQCSAMAQTTAYTCAAFCSLLLEDVLLPRVGGVYAPEDVGQFDAAYTYIISWLRDNAGFTFKVSHG